MPGPVGPNPSLTIAALADRMCTRLLEKPPATAVGGADLVRAGSAAADPGPGAPGSGLDLTSLSFSEEMSGTC
jgi:cholesterol oxidase